jgi:hypothetical protein
MRSQYILFNLKDFQKIKDTNLNHLHVENRSFGRLGAAIAEPNINEMMMLGSVSLQPTCTIYLLKNSSFQNGRGLEIYQFYQ